MKFKKILTFMSILFGVVACSSNEDSITTLKDTKILQVSDFEFMMGKKPAVTISFGLDGNGHFCSATIHRSSVEKGFTVNLKQKGTKNIDVDCHVGGKYFVTSTKHPTVFNFEIFTLNKEQKKVEIKVSGELVELRNESYMLIPESTLTITGNDFDNLIKLL